MPLFIDSLPTQLPLFGTRVHIEYHDGRPEREVTLKPGLAAFLITRYTTEHPLATVRRV